MTDNVPDRLNAILVQLKTYELDTGDPKWSSYALDRFLEEVMSAPGGSIQDIYEGLDLALKMYCVKLTGTVAAFIKDVVVRCFARYRHSYELVNWKEAAERLGGSTTQAQLYLALHAIPPQFLTPKLAEIITEGLEATAFRDETERALPV